VVCLTNLDGEDHVAEVNLTQTNLNSYIPSEWGQLQYLKILDLSQNSLFGTIPSELLLLPSLQEIDFSHNQFHGPVPVFSRADGMNRLLLKENDFQGTIPPDFFVGKRAMIEFSVMGNQLTGTISEAIGHMSLLEILELSSNGFSGMQRNFILEVAHLPLLNTVALLVFDLRYHSDFSGCHEKLEVFVSGF